MNILFLGSGAFGIPSLNALALSAHKILHILSQPDRPAGRGKHLTPTPVSQWALDRNVPLTRTENANAPDLLQMIRDLRPDAIAVIAFGQKLSNDFLALTKNPLINLHSSLLPKYRGAAPINWAVINNDPTAGVCVIEVTPTMDAGDILASASTPIDPAETAGELHDRLALLGSPLLPKVLDDLANGTVQRVIQDESLVTKAPKLSREIAWADFTQPAPLVSARIRGLSPWPGVKIELLPKKTDEKQKPIIATILKCRATSNTNSNAPAECGLVLPDRTIACGTGSLEILSIQPEGKKPMDLPSFANGYHLTPGAKLRSLIPPPARTL
ncbi:MAG TPA: methionyl-tRNA formyltransferase [Phycisphaerae bacterium]|nr:methionyl-tRNA formyltransferase [Phycisphaerae bacterium]